MAKSKDDAPKRRSFVAKWMDNFNKAATHTDRKKAAKRGKVKHRGARYNDDGGLP